MASTSTTVTTPDYITSLTKNLQPSKPLPVNTGPYLDQVGQMPVQAQMSPTDFQGSLGPNWAEMSKPGGFLDKAYQGQTQIMGENGQPLSIKQITDAVQGAGHTFTPNPFLAIPTLEGQLYQNESKNVGNVYNNLQAALQAGSQDYAQRTGQYANTIPGYFDQAGRDVSQFGQGRLAANQDFANSVGLGGTTGAGSQTSVLADQLARLGGINAVNKANAQATFAQRQGIIEDLLQQRALSAATMGAQSQSAIAQMAAQHWGLQDPNTLLSQYLMNKDQMGVAASQIELQKQQLAAQLLAALNPAAGGKKGGGGGRKGGGGSSAGGTLGASGLVPEDMYHDILQGSIDQNGTVTDQARTMVDNLMQQLQPVVGDPTNPATRNIARYTSRVPGGVSTVPIPTGTTIAWGGPGT